MSGIESEGVVAERDLRSGLITAKVYFLCEHSILLWVNLEVNQVVTDFKRVDFWFSAPTFTVLGYVNFVFERVKSTRHKHFWIAKSIANLHKKLKGESKIFWIALRVFKNIHKKVSSWSVGKEKTFCVRIFKFRVRRPSCEQLLYLKLDKFLVFG